MAKGLSKLKGLKPIVETIAGAASKTPGFVPLAAGGGLFAADAILKPLISGIMRKDPLEGARKGIGEEMRRTLLGRMRRERLKREARELEMRLAARNPQLYNEIRAGSRLAPGEVEIGGTPRTDLMELLASQAAQGQFQQPQRTEDLVQQMLG